MLKIEHKIIGLSFLAGLFFWAMDAIFDFYYQVSDVSFLRILFLDAPGHGFLIRPFVVAIFITLGCVIAKYVCRTKAIENRYQQLFDNLDDLIFVFSWNTDEWKAIFTEINPAACRKLGYSKDELLQLSPDKLVMPEKLAEIPSLWEAFKADKHILFEITLVGKNGDKIPVEINAHMGLFEGRPSVLTIVRDISQRQRREEEIRRLASFPQLDPHPVLEVDTAGKVIYANVAAQKTIERVGGGGVEEFLPADLGDMIKSAQETGVNLVYREKAVKDTIFEESINFTPGYNVMRLYIMDITEKQRAEKALRDSEGELRLLTSRLLNVQENERRRISAELHDELGQALMLFKLKLHALKDRLRKDQKSLREECGHSLQYLDGIIENVRRLSRDLSPTVLEELGLSSAIRLCLEEFSKHYEVQDLSVDLDEVDDLFPPRVQLNIYRIFQECLTNIGRHARAAKISLAVKKERDRVVFRIQDDGQGFDVNQARARESSARGIGLATMAERVRMIGGSLEIRSHTGSGTEIIFAVPLVTRREAEDGPIPDNIS